MTDWPCDIPYETSVTKSTKPNVIEILYPMYFIFLASAIISITMPFQDGMLKGVTRDGLNIFKGIPFARPPVGQFRFQPSISARINTTIDATSFGKSCIQAKSSNFLGRLIFDISDDDSSEDCLTINVFSPSNASNLPVMIWTYGGSFSSGSSASPRYDGEKILTKRKDFVFVSYNYRIGAFGFMSTKTLSESKSLNVGLRDQVLAHQWVKDNIQLFGGDPKKVTSTGESAGAIGISKMMLMDDGKQDLFQRALLLSGPPGLYHPTSSEFSPKSNKIAAGVGCGGDDMACLVKAEPFALRDASSSIQFEPILDFDYIRRQTLQSFQQSTFAKIPVLIHSNKDEGSVFALNVDTLEEAKKFRRDLTPFYTESDHQSLDVIYTGDPFTQASQFFADQVFLCPGLATARTYSSANLPTFKVVNTHLNILTRPINLLKDIGVFHSSELQHLFQIGVSRFETDFSNRLYNSYIGYVVDGNPGFGTYNGSVFDIAKNEMVPDRDVNMACQVLIDTAQRNYVRQGNDSRNAVKFGQGLQMSSVNGVGAGWLMVLIEFLAVSLVL